MTVRQTLRAIHAHGVTLALTDDLEHLRIVGSPPPDLLQDVRRYKWHLIACLLAARLDKGITLLQAMEQAGETETPRYHGAMALFIRLDAAYRTAVRILDGAPEIEIKEEEAA